MKHITLILAIRPDVDPIMYAKEAMQNVDFDKSQQRALKASVDMLKAVDDYWQSSSDLDVKTFKIHLETVLMHLTAMLKHHGYTLKDACENFARRLQLER